MALSFGAYGEDGRLLLADFKNVSEMRAKLKPKGASSTMWYGAAVVTRESFSLLSSTETQWYSATTGEYLYSDYSWTQFSRIASGTIIALPTEDFKEEKTFTYFDSDGTSVVTGKLVSVQIGISASGKSPNPSAKMRAVKSLCESGAAIPDSQGKPGRIIALKSAAKRRFGASSAEVYYNEHAESRVVFLLLKCDPKKAESHVTSMYYQGAKRKG